MRILITTDLYKPTINGVVTSVLNLERELRAHGHEVKVLTISDQPYSYYQHGVYYLMSMPSGIYPEVRIPISRGDFYGKEIIEWNPDVVHSQCEFFTFGIAKRIAKASGAALLHTYHTLYEQYTQYVPVGEFAGKVALRSWMRGRLRTVDGIIAPTNKVKDTLQEYKMNNEIHVIPSGINLEKFAEPVEKEEIDALKEKYGIEEDKKVILSLGRLGFEKQTEELIYGLEKLWQMRKDIMLVIVGDGPARKKLESLVEELKLSVCVKFTGMIKPEAIAIHYKLGDVFVCASTSETQGLTYIEASASGLPLVCRQDPCLEGVLKDGENGFAYDTLEELVANLDYVCTNNEWRKAAGERSRELAADFGTRKFGESMIRRYTEMIQKESEVGDENFTIWKKSENSSKKWCGTSYGYAKGILGAGRH